MTPYSSDSKLFCMPPEATPPSDGPTTRIVTGLQKLALVIRHQSWKASGERGLTPTQSQILVLLASLPGDLGVKLVAEQLAVTKGTASEAVSALERKGLLIKTDAPADGRAIVLELTRRGRKEAVRSREWPEVLLRAADSLPASEQAGLVRGLVGMIRTLQELGAVPLSRMCVGCRYFRPNVAPASDRAHYCNYIDAPIGDAELQIDCPEMEPVEAGLGPQLWAAFSTGQPFEAGIPD